jgi:hypothetical protein
MFDAEKQLFCHRLWRSSSGMVRDGLSPRYTMMTLLGLDRAEKAGMSSPVNVRRVLDGMLREIEWITNIGDLGLLVWTCAVIWPERLQETCRHLAVEAALRQYPDARKRPTMELAWFVTGLAHARLARPEFMAALHGTAREAVELLRGNQGSYGTFGHAGAGQSVNGFVRGHAGSFADQVYPIYALSTFSKAFRDQSTLDAARRCADSICSAQGALGQWWWHYDARSGQVLEEYPVYSVHQHAMGPMALFALQEAAGGNYNAAIHAGLRWISGKNELGYDMRDRATQLVWRSFYHTRRAKVYAARLRALAGWQRRSEPTDDLRVVFECRPYELGWMLYAFAGREGTTAAGDPA